MHISPYLLKSRSSNDFFHIWCSSTSYSGQKCLRSNSRATASLARPRFFITRLVLLAEAWCCIVMPLLPERFLRLPGFCKSWLNNCRFGPVLACLLIFDIYLLTPMFMATVSCLEKRFKVRQNVDQHFRRFFEVNGPSVAMPIA